MGSPAIRFRCPKCKTTLTVDESDVGTKAPCPGCGQRLQVPTPPAEPTASPPTSPPQESPLVPISISCPKCGKTGNVPNAYAGRRVGCNCGYSITVPGAEFSQQVSQRPTAHSFDFQTTPSTLERLPANHFDSSASASDQRSQASKSSEAGVDVKGMLVIAACTCAVLGVVLWAVSSIMEDSGKDVMRSIGIGLSAIAIVLWCVMGHGRANACSSCHRWWASVSCGRTLVDKKLAYKTVTRTDQTTGNRWGISAKGRFYSGTSSSMRHRKEQVKVLRHTFENHYECKHCGHRWDEVTVEDTENFEIDVGS